MKGRKIKTLFIIILTSIYTITSNEYVYAKPMISAEQAVLMDQESGLILYEKNTDNPQLIASITKVMTAIIAIEHGELTDQVKISQQAVSQEGSSIYLTENESMTLEDLIYGLMLQSGNDAAIAIAEHIGGSADGFVYLMNEKAKWLGMDETHFSNPHGLDADDHYSTAKDMAQLMRYAMEDDVFAEINRTKSYQAKSRTYAWQNKNKLLTNYYPYTIGGKTGYTKAAGRTLITVAEKDGTQLIVVTINDPNDWFDHMRLYEWGFEQIEQSELATHTSLENMMDKSLNEVMVHYFKKMVGLQ
ncbi:D-alanyl-D-alanine carboxypeptidase [Amphibacillus sp. MSJ-3]|uniref:D-alanyl-D-alanine carboxypeptidase family protein n=1 Tax=Amphibacillus sp. MSJ-3 TaxID=2841505 RepID=UPI001C0E9532|nr:D-alanyl-D-alanine carboxypeptidase family protein [Amphibacillus sp. MSJ-3]MBU5594265.1 D-alanyl-D-alanine carboxypeptidase [Amphibacillus sp. MSJ-3]